MAAERQADSGTNQPSLMPMQTPQVINLVEGRLTGDLTVGESLRHGDFGLGTLNLVSRLPLSHLLAYLCCPVLCCAWRLAGCLT